MTDKQIQTLKDTLPKGIGSWQQMTHEQRVLCRELALREYINSCLIYNSEYHIIKDGQLNPELKGTTWAPAYINDYVSEERAMELYHEQKESFKKATVKVGVFTDFEGCTYNSCVWGDE